MFRFIIALALVASVAPPSASISRSVHLVIAVPADEVLEGVEQSAIIAQAQDALTFWQDHSPITTTLMLASDMTILDLAPSINPYADTGYYRPFEHWGQSDIYVMVVENSASRAIFAEGAAGFADPGYGFAAAVAHGYPGEDALGATLAHELGHVLYGLPDRGWCSDDLMCSPSPVAAYRAGWLGCRTLETLGAPCARVWVPLIQK